MLCLKIELKFCETSIFSGSSSSEVEVKKTTNLETNLHGLAHFANYSLRIAAYTGAGDGERSTPIFCTTEEDGEESVHIFLNIEPVFQETEIILIEL